MKELSNSVINNWNASLSAVSPSLPHCWFSQVYVRSPVQLPSVWHFLCIRQRQRQLASLPFIYTLQTLYCLNNYKYIPNCGCLYDGALGDQCNDWSRTNETVCVYLCVREHHSTQSCLKQSQSYLKQLKCKRLQFIWVSHKLSVCSSVQCLLDFNLLLPN